MLKPGIAIAPCFSTMFSAPIPFVTKLVCQKKVLQLKEHDKWSREPRPIFAVLSSFGLCE